VSLLKYQSGTSGKLVGRTRLKGHTCRHDLLLQWLIREWGWVSLMPFSKTIPQQGLPCTKFFVARAVSPWLCWLSTVTCLDFDSGTGHVTVICEKWNLQYSSNKHNEIKLNLYNVVKTLIFYAVKNCSNWQPLWWLHSLHLSWSLVVVTAQQIHELTTLQM
jgi:hypothetical protein